MAAKPKVNYDLIEPDWRAGIKSPNQLVAEYTAATGVSVTRMAIVNHFEKAGIPRDMKAKIKAKADAKVAASLVAPQGSRLTTATETAIVEANAEQNAQVQIRHRADINAAQALTKKLWGELLFMSDNATLFDELEDLMRGAKDDDGATSKELRRKLNVAYQQALGHPGRVRTNKELADTLKTLVGLEREAYSIAAGSGGTSPFEEALRQIREAA